MNSIICKKNKITAQKTDYREGRTDAYVPDNDQIRHHAKDNHKSSLKSCMIKTRMPSIDCMEGVEVKACLFL